MEKTKYPHRPLFRFAEKDGKRKLVVAYTDLDARTSEEKRQVCRAMVGTVGYGQAQLVLMALSERYHLPVPHSPSRVVCSEAVSRILYPQIDLRDARRKRHDMVNPNSAWRRWLEMKCGYGDHIVR